VIALAQASSSPPGLYVLDADGAETRRVTPEGLAVQFFGWTVSPDGSEVAVAIPDKLEIFSLVGGEARTILGDLAGRTLIGWIVSGLLVAEDRGAGRAVLLVDPTSGALSDWQTIEPRDPTGIMGLMDTFFATPDGRGYGYTWHRAVSDLYLAEGWS
jgi:hypothetical protein